MYCCMNKAWLTVGCLLAACLLEQATPSLAQVPLPPAAAQTDEILRIRSNGRTRIEIHAGSQVAVYTGGVQFEYRDYRLSADRLRYSQADSFAEATGNVLLEQSGSRLETERIELYLADNGLVCPGEIHGSLSEQGLSFSAAQATVQLSGQPGDSESSYRVTLLDNVYVYSGEGYSFNTTYVTMDTGTGLLNVPQQFSLRLPSGTAGQQAAAGASRMLGDLVLTGSSMTGKLDDDLQLRNLHALATELRGEQLQFSAGSINANFEDNGHDGIMIDLLATGSPVRGLYRQPGEDLLFSAESIAGTIDPGYGSQFLLSGGIDLSADMALLQSDRLRIVQDAQGVRLVFPEGLEAGMALDVISGNEDFDLSTILHR